MLSVKSRVGDHEWNQKDNTGYKIGVNNEKIFIDNNEANNPKKLAPGWLFMASVTSLLVLTVLAYVRWKSKQ